MRLCLCIGRLPRGSIEEAGSRHPAESATMASEGYRCIPEASEMSEDASERTKEATDGNAAKESDKSNRVDDGSLDPGLPENVYGGALSAFFQWDIALQLEAACKDVQRLEELHALSRKRGSDLVKSCLPLYVNYVLQFKVLYLINSIVKGKLEENPTALSVHGYEDSSCGIFLSIFAWNIFSALKDWIYELRLVFSGTLCDLVLRKRARILSFALVLLPELICFMSLLFLGSRYLVMSEGLEELLLNCVALAFVAELDEFIFAGKIQTARIAEVKWDRNREANESVSIVAYVLYYAAICLWPMVFKFLLRLHDLHTVAVEDDPELDGHLHQSLVPVWTIVIVVVIAWLCVILSGQASGSRGEDPGAGHSSGVVDPARVNYRRRCTRCIFATGAVPLIVLLFNIYGHLQDLGTKRAHEDLLVERQRVSPTADRGVWKIDHGSCPGGLTACEFDDGLCVDLSDAMSSPLGSTYSKNCPVEASEKTCTEMATQPGWRFTDLDLGKRGDSRLKSCIGSFDAKASSAFASRHVCDAIGSRLCRAMELETTGRGGWTAHPCKTQAGSSGYRFRHRHAWHCYNATVTPIRGAPTCCADAHATHWACDRDLPGHQCSTFPCDAGLGPTRCASISGWGELSTVASMFDVDVGVEHICACAPTTCKTLRADGSLMCMKPTEPMLRSQVNFTVFKDKKWCSGAATEFLGTKLNAQGCAAQVSAQNRTFFFFYHQSSLLAFLTRHEKGHCYLVDAEHCHDFEEDEGGNLYRIL